jgi:hypothetical protein
MTKIEDFPNKIVIDRGDNDLLSVKKSGDEILISMTECNKDDSFTFYLTLEEANQVSNRLSSIIKTIEFFSKNKMKTENPYDLELKELPYKECETRCHRCEDCYLPCFEGIKAKYYREGYAAAMADNAPIAFKDRLPETGQRILCLGVSQEVERFSKKHYNSQTGVFEPNDGNYLEFTHWLPLPTIPQTNN